MSKTFDSAELISRLEFYFDHNKNVLLSGHKGIGKTAIISEVFNKKAKNWLYFSASCMDPWVDFIGVPKEKVLDNGETVLEFIRPQYMNDDIEAIFLDEYNRANKKIRNSVMELIQFKSINGKKFPNLKVVWAGVNPYNPDDDDEEIYDVEPLDPAQKDRFQVQIELPYSIDESYFANKFGKTWSDGAVEWWTELPDKIKKMVSPRRLDYALEIHQIGGTITDALPHESNPSKLVASLGLGGIQKIIEKIFKNRDVNGAKAFVADENNYRSACHLLVGDSNRASFFWPLLDEERQLALFFSSPVMQDIIFHDPIHYRGTLEIAEKNKLCNKELLRKIEHIMKKIRGISLDDFNDNSIVPNSISMSGIMPNGGKGIFGSLFTTGSTIPSTINSNSGATS